MSSIRAWCLGGARSLRVVLKDAGTARTLLYTCTAKDGVRGSICVHTTPPEFHQIQDWLRELDLDLKYTGQGLPATSAHVLLLLDKRGKMPEYLTVSRRRSCWKRTDLCARSVARRVVPGSLTTLLACDNSSQDRSSRAVSTVLPALLRAQDKPGRQEFVPGFYGVSLRAQPLGCQCIVAEATADGIPDEAARCHHRSGDCGHGTV